LTCGVCHVTKMIDRIKELETDLAKYSLLKNSKEFSREEKALKLIIILNKVDKEINKLKLELGDLWSKAYKANDASLKNLITNNIKVLDLLELTNKKARLTLTYNFL